MPTASGGKISSGARRMESPLIVLQRNIKQFISPFVHWAQTIKDISQSIQAAELKHGSRTRLQSPRSHSLLSSGYETVLSQLKHGIYLNFSYNTKPNPCLYLINKELDKRPYVRHLTSRLQAWEQSDILRYTSLHWYACIQDIQMDATV